MNATSAATASAVTFVWLGMVLAISFLEAPLKFRAPGVTIPLGLGIGRLVFRALNLVECALAAVVVVTVAVGDPPARVLVWTGALLVLLVAQLAVIRPRLNRRSDRVLAGEDLPRSRGHLLYVAFEAAKVVALLGLGVTLSTL
ncbi:MULTISPECIES: hypothetical protein [unclassified Streptomyces]|jgi:hypothetical protein|uniref:hypothetical protein n=1 Tax=unclassified Streptomyces TaxID=2593676 RepID=UPI001BAEE643|nr:MULTISPECIES: hypothetical protein [unclassified Streptomyces]MDH6454798.1 hypothetical protein [Streptomyces sp. SAI-119]MDH6494646.1 hypothetical protein [Streptomyces sp. SAI-149]QUC58223.1 hypothetical protein IOD14_16200 [Streptomyces sp. A2-16]